MKNVTKENHSPKLPAAAVFLPGQNCRDFYTNLPVVAELPDSVDVFPVYALTAFLQLPIFLSSIVFVKKEVDMTDLPNLFPMLYRWPDLPADNHLAEIEWRSADNVL